MSVSWKRRFFEFSGDALLFYRDSQVTLGSPLRLVRNLTVSFPQDRTQPMDTLSFGGGRVASIKEPAEAAMRSWKPSRTPSRWSSTMVMALGAFSLILTMIRLVLCLDRAHVWTRG